MLRIKSKSFRSTFITENFEDWRNGFRVISEPYKEPTNVFRTTLGRDQTILEQTQEYSGTFDRVASQHSFLNHRALSNSIAIQTNLQLTRFVSGRLSAAFSNAHGKQFSCQKTYHRWKMKDQSKANQNEAKRIGLTTLLRGNVWRNRSSMLKTDWSWKRFKQQRKKTSNINRHTKASYFEKALSSKEDLGEKNFSRLMKTFSSSKIKDCDYELPDSLNLNQFLEDKLWENSCRSSEKIVCRKFGTLYPKFFISTQLHTKNSEDEYEVRVRFFKLLS